MKQLIIATTFVLSIGLVAAPPPPQGGKVGPQRSGSLTKHGEQRPAPKASAQKPGKGYIQKHQPERGRRFEIRPSHRQMNMRGAGRLSSPPHHTGFHAGRPHGARFWGRPGVPPVMAGARSAWAWVSAPWNYMIDGVYYYGEGYYFDGYNYCYNGGFHLVPPPVQVVQPTVVAPAPVAVPAQPTVVVPQQPVVVPAQPAVVTPPVQTVVTPATTVVTPPPPPPPPPRRRGLLDILFGN